eukprot:CAMPEP_0170120186 /NCGR_PEP_ID=MMETSP0020_2-20130122/14966_1 /TAXON_ID=98059 /ORGANISM="Dinobryon sp., Strain UTEXLB2267" /LENGTH=889 /DNA_ID=CAMNT_0010349949 /DNA_START=12 /DNA_END=2681 /DNA_ORIENTATION=-
MAAKKSTTTRSALSDELTLYTTREEGDKVSFTYEAECSVLKAVTLSINFEGSVNFAIDDFGSSGPSETGKLILKSTIRPFTRHRMGRLVLVDRTKRASLKMGCSWTAQEALESETEQYMSVHNAQIQAEINNVLTIGFPRALDDPALRGVEDSFNKYGKKFVDMDFKPLQASLFVPNGPKSTDGKQAASSTTVTKKHPPVEFKRAHEFLATEDYQVFSGAIEPSDIKQGALGDCWFLCALAAIAEFPVIVKNLFPSNSSQKNSTGAYFVRFCKMGFWTQIRVDDFFPCYPGGGPIYSRAHGPELWVLLLEKAFAKYCGSYEAIKSGWAYEAMTDLTGAPYENYRFDDADVKEKIANGSFWSMLLSYDAINYIVSASTPGEDVWTETGTKPGKDSTGLVAGHAYTLLMVRQSSKGHQLVKLRNPWGSMEWSGDWSDSSPLWTKEMQDEIEPLVKEDDGTFWMSFSDMLKFFSGINVCMVRGIPDSKGHTATAPWKEVRRRFFFDFAAVKKGDEVSAERRITCPCYELTIPQSEGEFYFSVHQQDIRCADAKPYMDIGVTILQEQHGAHIVEGSASESSRKYKFIAGTGISASRQNQSEKIQLSAGKYLVVPISTGCKLETFIENYTKQVAELPNTDPVKLVITDAAGVVVDFTDDVYRAYTEIFYRMDSDSDGYLSKPELDHFMVLTEGATVTDEAFAWMVSNFGSKTVANLDERGGIPLAGFIRAQLFVFKHVGSNEEKLRHELALLGYDAYLQVLSSRQAALVVHGCGKMDYTLTAQDFNPAAYEDACELHIRKNGKCTSYEGGKINLFVHKSGYNGVSFLVENKHSSLALIFTLDCSKSKNVCSHRGSLSHQATIPPGGDVIMHNLMPVNDRVGWSWTYSASYIFDD